MQKQQFTKGGGEEWGAGRTRWNCKNKKDNEEDDCFDDNEDGYYDDDDDNDTDDGNDADNDNALSDDDEVFADKTTSFFICLRGKT